jgi:A/G-specific adenine glycosylase
MLQQTRVAAVLPYYEKFLAKYPDVAALAAAEESDLLAAWAGLGYYSRARNLHAAAKRIAELGSFPQTLEGIRALPGVGEYTAAAVASIAFGIPAGVLDGNVVRVMARVTCDDGDPRAHATRDRLRQVVDSAIDRHRPGEYNQSLMELGATICLPQSPKCLICPINDICCARKRGLEQTLPTRSERNEPIAEAKVILVIHRGDMLLLWQRPSDDRRLAGFWELPESGQLKRARAGKLAGSFRHAIVNHTYTISVYAAKLTGRPPNLYQWFSRDELGAIPLSTIARKSIQLWEGSKKT